MKFNNDYFNALDKENPYSGISARYLGTSTHPAKDQLQELKSRIFWGASTVEIGFAGRGKEAGRAVPEVYGKEEREAIKQLSKINEVTTSVHAPVNVIGFSGLGEGGFREEIAADNMQEVKRTIDFAADTTQGGPIVIHTGEFPREISKFKGFEAYKGESEKAPVYLVDERTGAIKGFRRDIEVMVPKVDENGEYVLKKNKETGEIAGGYEYEPRRYDYYVKEAKKIHEETGEKVDPAMLMFKESEQRELQNYEFEEKRYFDNVRELEEKYKGLKKLENSIEEQAKTNPEDAKHSAMLRLKDMGIREPDPFVEIDEYKNYKEDPIKFLKEIIGKSKNQIDFYSEAALSYGRARATKEEEMKHIKPLEGYAIQKSADNIAKAAIYAYDKEKAQNLEKPLFIAPENVFPEQYGGHPEELKNIILESRESMAKRLIDERNMDEDEAKNIAKEHIKATFDIAHANTWKKFFSGKEDEFKDWMIDQVKNLQEEGIIGHVHLSDNFGYHDTHLAPGQGNVPIKEFVDELQKEGKIPSMIIEAGGQAEGQEYKVLTSAWKVLGSPIYRTSWSEVEGSYFGRTSPTRYVIGGYAPSAEYKGGPFWSGVGLQEEFGA